MNLADSTPNRLALPNESRVKPWQAALVVGFVLLLLGSIVGFLVWGARRKHAQESQTVRPTFATGQSPKFAIPSTLSGFSSNDIQVKTNDGAAVNGLEVLFGGEPATPELQVANPEILKPGSYTIEVVKDGKRVFTQDFSWGVLALNFPKSVYTPGEDVALDIAVLDERGGMVCDAQVSLEIVSPSGKKQTLSTKSGQIVAHPECQKKEYVSVPDYEAQFKVEETGNHQMKLTAVTRNGTYWIQDFVPVEENPRFVVERNTNTRIYPPENYPVSLTIYSRDGFKGSIAETLRSDFTLGDDHTQLIEGKATEAGSGTEAIPKVSIVGDKMQLTWEAIDIAAGASKELRYEFNAPDVSPELFAIGPTELKYSEENKAYVYERMHQLAMDDLPPAAPVGWWKFDENTGTTAKDTSGQANNLTLSSASWNPLGKAGSAWNGTGAVWVSRADDDDFDFTGSDSFAISLWFKSDSASNPGSQEWLVNKSLSGGTQQAGYAIYAKTTGVVCFGWDDDTTWTPDSELCTTADVYDANWHHFLVTRNATSTIVSLYVDNILINSVPVITTTVDSTGDVGSYASIEIGTDGYPIIAYRDVTNLDLKVTKCGNTLCSLGNTTTTIDSTGSVGAYASIAIGTDGFPIISYFDSSNGDLKVAKCGNADCSSGNTLTTVDSTNTVGDYTSIAIGTDGYPVISYRIATGINLKLAKCGNAACSSGNTLTVVDSTGDVGYDTSVAIGTDGYPVISYWDLTNADLKVAKCGNATCSSGNTVTTLDSTGDVGRQSSITIGTDGFPVISYHDYTNWYLKVAKCGNAACSSGTNLTTVDSTANVGMYSSIAIGTDGSPIISYAVLITAGLKVAKCENAACSSGTALTTIDSTQGHYSSIAIGTDGYPVISSYDNSNGDLRFAKCSNTRCSSTGVPSGSSANSRVLYLGDRQGADAGDEFNGDLDEVQIFRTAFAREDVESVYHAVRNSLGESVATEGTPYCPPGQSCTTPFLHWKLDDNAGTNWIADASGNGYAGRMFGSQTASPWVSGVYGAALQFDGTNDYVQASVPTASNTFSFGGWFKTGNTHQVDTEATSGTAGTTGQRYAVYPQQGGSDAAAGISVGTNGISVYEHGNSYLAPLAVYSATIGSGWNHVFVVYDNKQPAILLNGRKVWTGLTSTKTNVYSPSMLTTTGGLGGGPYGYFGGEIDDVRIYGYARTQKEIAWDMNQGEPALHYKFDEGSGTTISNASSTGATYNLSMSSFSSPATSTSGWSNEGRVGKTLTFDGTDDVAVVGAWPLGAAPTGNVSFSFWLKFPATIASTQWVGMASQGVNPGGGTSYLGFYINAAQKVGFNSRAASFGTTTGLATVRTLSPNTWYHVVGVAESSGTMKLYVNGKDETSTITSLATLTGFDTFAFGAEYTSGGSITTAGEQFFSGQIDEFKVYNYALGAEEILMEYNQGKSTVLGSTGTDSSANPDNSRSRAYCVPGDTSTCTPPVGEWSLDENTGSSASDQSGNGNAGGLTNGPIWSPGKVGQSVTFDGSNDYITMGDPASGVLDFTGSITFSAWIYPTSIAASNRTIFSKKSALASDAGYAVQLATTTGQVVLAIGDGSNNVYSVAGGAYAPPLNQWSHLEVVFNRISNQFSVYGNGVLKGNTSISSVTGSVASSTSYFLGQIASGGYFQGAIDDARIYDYARTQAQVAWDYNRGQPTAWWRMDECTGTTINDASGNSFTGTLTIGGGGTNTSTGTCSSGTTTQAWNNGSSGKVNSSLSFDSTDDYISISDADALRFNSGAQDFSIFAWVKRGATGTTHYIVSKEDADNDGYRLQFNSANTITCSVDSIDITSSATITDSNWHHIGCVVDRDGSGQIYVDGMPSGSPVSISSEAMATTSALRIGSRSYTATSFFNGQIDDVRIYNYVLTAQQIRDAMNSGAAGFR